ncbi:hypothetical protein [Streptomyces sp. NPDC087300]
MIIPFLVGITVLATVATVGAWVCMEFCKALRERRQNPGAAGY